MTFQRITESCKDFTCEQFGLALHKNIFCDFCKCILKKLFGGSLDNKSVFVTRKCVTSWKRCKVSCSSVFCLQQSGIKISVFLSCAKKTFSPQSSQHITLSSHYVCLLCTERKERRVFLFPLFCILLQVELQCDKKRDSLNKPCRRPGSS